MYLELHPNIKSHVPKDLIFIIDESLAAQALKLRSTQAASSEHAEVLSEFINLREENDKTLKDREIKLLKALDDNKAKLTLGNLAEYDKPRNTGAYEKDREIIASIEVEIENGPTFLMLKIVKNVKSELTHYWQPATGFDCYNHHFTQSSEALGKPLTEKIQKQLIDEESHL